MDTQSQKNTEEKGNEKVAGAAFTHQSTRKASHLLSNVSSVPRILMIVCAVDSELLVARELFAGAWRALPKRLLRRSDAP
eukprot:scaffold4703_cov189-Pinguiococcus_pyrenoidosus.AAC.2